MMVMMLLLMVMMLMTLRRGFSRKESAATSLEAKFTVSLSSFIWICVYKGFLPVKVMSKSLPWWSLQDSIDEGLGVNDDVADVDDSDGDEDEDYDHSGDDDSKTEQGRQLTETICDVGSMMMVMIMLLTMKMTMTVMMISKQSKGRQLTETMPQFLELLVDSSAGCVFFLFYFSSIAVFMFYLFWFVLFYNWLLCKLFSSPCTLHHQGDYSAKILYQRISWLH